MTRGYRAPQQINPHSCAPCVITVYFLTKMLDRTGSMASFTRVCAGHVSIEIYSKSNAEDQTLSVVTLQLPDVSKYPVKTTYDVRSLTPYTCVGMLFPTSFPCYHHMSER
ncbi:hypothetical protein TNCV_1281861 [Trichonephila clavipes]|uniref:Uncharacterized protein n=1 Tax=Trichonephila clavipes TaxID=2585209 RepID=A0A8X6SQ24_TRICX|nr:hypothetical protein TNCV_1281861 [Trichonephila clavipes]